MFQVPSYIQGLRTLADNTIRLTVDCQELSPEECAQIFMLKGKQGWFVFKENEIKAEDIPDTNVEFKGDKTPSQRLRNCLYVYWKEQTSQTEDFNTFYTKWIEKKLEEIKNYL